MGTNIYAARFHGVMSLTESTFTSYMNSIYLDEGFDLVTKDLLLEYQNNTINYLGIHPSNLLYDYLLVKKDLNATVIESNNSFGIPSLDDGDDLDQSDIINVIELQNY